MSNKNSNDDLTTDSVPDAPREVTSTSNDEDDSQAEKEKEPPKKTPKAKPTKANKPPRPHKNVPHQSPPPQPGIANITYNISNATNLHIGNVTTVYATNNVVPMSSKKSPTPRVKKTAEIVELCNNCDAVTEADLDIASDHVGHNWKDVGKRLDFSQGQLEQIYENHNHTKMEFKEVVYQMLLAWKQYKADKATIGVLCESLWLAKQYDAVQHLAKERS